MRVLSIKPPFSIWIMAGLKKTEFRRYQILPGPLAIHASAQHASSAEIAAWILTEYGQLPATDVLDELCRLAGRTHHGVILGQVTVTHTTRSNTVWGRCCNHLGDPVPLAEPLPYKGKRGIWHVDIQKLTGYPRLFTP